VIGALGIVLFDHAETTLQPLIEKFSLLQRDLDEARRELATQRLRQSGQRQSKYTFASFIGLSAAAVEVKRQARRAAQSSSPVLLLGETGTGKELLAHAIHAASARAAGPFISVNIAAVPDTLLEAEFFGFAPGAFTGADRKGRDGKFRLAHGGTLFLDEIGDMPLALQSKLLRALQEGEIEPLGSNKLIPIDVRVIAATSRDLSRLVREGGFREDLFYRLNVYHPCASVGVTSPRCWRYWAKTLHCAADCRHLNCQHRHWPCWRRNHGAATSANCATCWSKRPCAAIHRALRCRNSKPCCASLASSGSSLPPQWEALVRRRSIHRRLKWHPETRADFCVPYRCRWKSWSARRFKRPWRQAGETRWPQPRCWALPGQHCTPV
jgi:hypothetical protein